MYVIVQVIELVRLSVVLVYDEVSMSCAYKIMFFLLGVFRVIFTF